METHLRAALLICLLALSAFLLGCGEQRDYRPLGAVTLAEQAEGLLLRAYPEASSVRFDHEYGGEASYAEDRFPEWAREGGFDYCIAWSDGFEALRADRTPVVEGTVWGWVLLEKENLIYGSRVLEVSFENRATEETITLLDRWGLDLVEIGVEALTRQAEALLPEAFPDTSSVMIPSRYEGAEAGEVTRDEERFPAWAEGEYETCIHWVDNFQVIDHARSFAGSGDIWGWVLVSTTGRTHILEISYENVLTDPWQRATILDAWDGPTNGNTE